MTDLIRPWLEGERIAHEILRGPRIEEVSCFVCKGPRDPGCPRRDCPFNEPPEAA